jgi:hypothetical protein
MEVFTWILAGLSIAGVILNIRKSRVSYWIWAFTNAAWAWIDFRADLTAQGVLFLGYFALSIWGIFSWRIQGVMPANQP